MTNMIPVYKPTLLGNEKKYVNDCLETTWISSKGKYIEQFEDSFKTYIGVSYASAVSNGTVALHLALLALGIGKDDEVIVPTLTYIASVNSISYVGAIPVFVDSLNTSWQIDPNDVRKKITSRSKAIIVVHLYGHPCEMDEILKIAKEHNLFVVEDCAEAIGSRYNNKLVGNFGDISTFSFFGNKTITTGEGGMVITNNKTLHERVVHLKGQGLAKYREYWHDVVGYNYRMTNICAAIGLAQLERIDEIIYQKRKIAQSYSEQLNNLPLIFHQEDKKCFHSYWMNTILVNNIDDRDKLRSFLAEKNVETRPIFYPIHTMPMYSLEYNNFPIAEDIGWRGINLPSFPDLTIKEIEYICQLIKAYFDEFCKN